MKSMSMFIINSTEKLKEKMELIQNLIDIQVAHDIIKDKHTQVPAFTASTKVDKVELKPSPLDGNFSSLKIQMETLKPGGSEYKMIDSYI